MRRLSIALVCSFLGFAACGDDSDNPPPPDTGVPDSGTPDGAPPDTGTPPGPATAVFDVAATGSLPWLGVPYPSDLYLGADGKIDLATAPIDNELWNSIRDRLARYDGFCRGCAITFGLEGVVDSSSIPADAAVGATAATTDAVLMMNVTGGELIPVEVDYAAIDGALTVRASELRTLPPNETYVVAITSDLLANDGSPLQATELFQAVRDMDSGGPDGADRARAVVGPGLDALETAGVDVSRIVAATVFTTRDTGTHLTQIAAVVDGAPLPTAVVDQVILSSDGALDAFAGTPAEDLPGSDNPADPATEGETAIVHDAIEMVILGRFQAPRIVEGTGTDIGFVRYDGDDAVMAGPQEDVPFLLAIPVGADVSSLPVAIAQTGNPGTREFGMAVANTLAEIGVATIAVDPFQMGERAASAVDEQHNLRGGDLGPDGLSEHTFNGVRLRFQGLEGSPAGLLLHPGYSHGASSQFTSDFMATIRFIEEGDVSAIAGADAALTGFAFDADQLFSFSLSTGSYTALSAMAGRGGVDAAALTVPYSALMIIACHAPGLRPSLDLLLSAIGITGMFDEVDRRLCMNPLFNLYRQVLEDIDAVAALHYLLNAPLHTDTPPDLLLQHAGLDQTISQLSGDMNLAEGEIPTGGDTWTPFTDVTMGTPPFTANRTTPNGTITLGAWFFDMAGHSMIEHQSQESTTEPPVRAPFVFRETPITVNNPIVEVHSQAQAFFMSRMTSGQATISAP